jgi:phage baseplate assembly protein gpV
MIEDILLGEEKTIEDTKRKMNGVQVGRVINVLDPLTLGRVQVQLPSIDALDLEPWARVAMPMASMLCGFYFIPQVGDQVLVAFEHGDLSAPYVIGSLWSAMMPPPQSSPLPQIRGIRTLSGNQLVFEELPPSVTIQTGPTSPIPMPMPPSPVGPYSTVRLSPTGIEIMNPVEIKMMCGTNIVKLGPEGLTVTVGGSVLSITAGGVTITSPAVTVAGTGTVSIAGATIRLNS